MYEVIQSATFARWLRRLRDRQAVVLVNARLRDASYGNLGDTASVGDGVSEMRIHYGPGYRLYFIHKGTRAQGHKGTRAQLWWCCCAAGTKTASDEIFDAPSASLRTGDDTMAETFTRWDAADYIMTWEDARLYLEAVAELDSGDGRLIRAALDDIARAQRTGRLGKDARMIDDGICEELVGNGSPTFDLVMRATRALGMQLRITA